MRPLYLLLLAFLFPVFLHAQQGAIRGFINDADLRTPITGANVNISGNKGDNSDLFGLFNITGLVPGEYEMTVSHIGYKTEILRVEVKAALLSTVNVNLHKSNLDLSEVKVNTRKSSDLNTIGAVDIKLRPVNTSQDVLRIVPGLFIAQHAGGGKAEQIFLRGFDIDHGTDIAITVDGMPVNMVSHAHGQGYADLHFLIPETVEKVNFDKGPYQAAKGNLATAAFVDFSTKNFLEHNSIKLESGQYNTQRAVAQFKVFNKQTEKSRQQFYIASEYSATDGYFKSPQDFHRFNLLAKYSAWWGNQSQLTLSASGFDSKWNASGQIPDRAVRSGLIDRFGAIDDREGGNTGRMNFSAKFNHQRKNGWKATDHLYYSRYHFNLYSNFTFFLEDDLQGDMINQREGRSILGFQTTESKTWLLDQQKAHTEFGAGFRSDDVKDIRLSKSPNRVFANDLQWGDVKEFNSYLYVNQDLELGQRWTINAGLRYDYFNFRYKNKLAGETGFARQTKGIASPKLNISFAPSPSVKLYLNNGSGFHSNDTRVILASDARDILPRVWGTDLGILFKPGKHLVLKTALWHLYSQQEFVYVGDAGVVEPSGKTRRMGVDVSARYQFNKWLFGDADINYTHANAIGAAKGEDFIPLAPSFTSIGGITARSAKGWSGALRYRAIGQRPANEDNSVKAQGYFLLDMIAGYRIARFEFHIAAENILNRSWREAQFDTMSRLRSEPDPVSEIHYTPGIPAFIKAGVTFNF